MPHAHVVVKLKDAPTFDGSSSELNSWVDSHVSAEVPDAATKTELCKLVQQQMTQNQILQGLSHKQCSKHFD